MPFRYVHEDDVGDDDDEDEDENEVLNLKLRKYSFISKRFLENSKIKNIFRICFLGLIKKWKFFF